MCDLKLLSRNEIISQLLSVKRENDALKSVILRQQVLCHYYQQLIDMKNKNAKLRHLSDNSYYCDELVCEKQIELIKMCDNSAKIVLTKLSIQNNSNICGANLSPEVCDKINAQNHSTNHIDIKYNNSILEKKNTKPSEVFINIDDSSSQLNATDISDTNMIEVKAEPINELKTEQNINFDNLNDNKPKMSKNNSNRTRKLKLIRCDQNGCNYTCCYRSNLFRHTMTVHRLKKACDTDSKYCCEHCGQQFQRKLLLFNHLMSAHQDVNISAKYKCDALNVVAKYKCDAIGCKYYAHFMTNMKEHRKSQHPELYGIKYCRETDAVCHETTSNQLTNFSDKCMNGDNFDIPLMNPMDHINRPNELICDFENCNLIFKNRTSLVKHRLTHRLNNRFVCSYPNCGQQFAHECQLNEHYCTHNQSIYNHQQYPITVYDQTFVLPQNNINNGYQSENDYQVSDTHSCNWPLCYFTSNNISELEQHFAKHMANKPLLCNYPNCQYKTANYSNLEEHQKRAHEIL